jgi:hypothetical protein
MTHICNLADFLESIYTLPIGIPLQLKQVNKRIKPAYIISSILPTSLDKNATDMVWAIVITQKLLTCSYSLFQV